MECGGKNTVGVYAGCGLRSSRWYGYYVSNDCVHGACITVGNGRSVDRAVTGGTSMKANDLKVMFSSETNEWATPQDFFEKLSKLYGPYDLDPCSTIKNAKCKYFFTEQDDGLSQDWSGYNVFMNPPYGRKIGNWIEKAYEESRKDNTTVTCLIPSRTDTKYWHDYCMKADKILFIKGRLKFGIATNAAPFPSAVVIFTGKNVTRPFLNNIPMIDGL